ncbi:MAG: ABATE domain-containing protein [Chloroflexi bacterium]|nr:ABATE domain-containing protein [Chloroflexota bacterium]
MLEEAERRPDEAVSVLERAIALREAIFRIFSAVAEESPAGELDLAALNGALSTALGRLRITPTERGYGWN